MQDIILESRIFWSSIFKEHAQFLYILLDPLKVQTLKEQALTFYSEWPTALTNIEDFIEQLMSLKYEILAASRGQAVNLYLPPKDFKMLVRHMISEAQFALLQLTNRLTAEDILLFWRQEVSEHTELAGKAILNDERSKIENLMLADELKDAPADYILDLIMEANLGAQDLANKMLSGKIISLLNIVMVNHEIREGKYGEMMIKNLYR